MNEKLVKFSEERAEGEVRPVTHTTQLSAVLPTL